MLPTKLYSQITKELSAQLLRKFNQNKWSLAELDEWRNSTVPQLLHSRFKENSVHLTKDELCLLMDWKLAKGKFRPALKKYIESNDEDTVKKVTETGLSFFLDKLDLEKKDWGLGDTTHYKWCADQAIKKLCLLKGVGPATATLLLSLLKDITALAPPFFSDEAFMYFIQDPLYPGKAIKYTAKEYLQYCEVLYRLYIDQKYLSLDAIEKGGWALKMLSLHKLDSLIDVKLTEDVPEDYLDSFPKTKQYTKT